MSNRLEAENKRLKEILAEIHDTDDYERALRGDRQFKFFLIGSFVGLIVGAVLTFLI